MLSGIKVQQASHSKIMLSKTNVKKVMDELREFVAKMTIVRIDVNGHYPMPKDKRIFFASKQLSDLISFRNKIEECYLKLL